MTSIALPRLQTFEGFTTKDRGCHLQIDFAWVTGDYSSASKFAHAIYHLTSFLRKSYTVQVLKPVTFRPYKEYVDTFEIKSTLLIYGACTP